MTKNVEIVYDLFYYGRHRVAHRSLEDAWAIVKRVH